MRVAVTGAAGFIGGAVVARLEALDHEPVKIDRSLGIDILDADLVNAAVEGCDAVIHLAGILGTSELFERPDLAVDVNVKGAIRVLDACRTAGAAYVGITMPDVFPSIYTATALARQHAAAAYHHAYGIPVTHIRAFNVYGPGQAWGPGHPQKIVPTFAARSWRREPMPVWGDGLQAVDLVHVDDVADTLVGAAVSTMDTNPQVASACGRCEVWDAGTGHSVTVLEVVQRVAEITGCGLVEFLPMRAGEIAQAELSAKDLGPFFSAKPWDRFTETVESYRPPATEAVT